MVAANMYTVAVVMSPNEFCVLNDDVGGVLTNAIRFTVVENHSRITRKISFSLQTKRMLKYSKN